MENYVGYVRTSTGTQNLGLEEQIVKIGQFISSNDCNLIDTIIEQESGKKNERKGLGKVIDLCTQNDYTLLVTKLDRLSREVEFLFTLKNKGIKIRCIELPELNTLTLGIFGAVAQWERELISKRTKDALNVLKSQNIILGKPQNFTNEGRLKGIQSIQRNKENNEKWRLAITFCEHYILKYGNINLTKISQLLNSEGYKTRNGSQFTPATVKRLIDRLNPLTVTCY
jgi:DNA invertase Pin-like site-specific DNA recombinase